MKIEITLSYSGHGGYPHSYFTAKIDTQGQEIALSELEEWIDKMTKKDYQVSLEAQPCRGYDAL